MLYLAEFDIQEDFDINYVSFEKLESNLPGFFSNAQIQFIRSLYDNLYKMEKVLIWMPVMQKTVIQKLRLQPLETSLYISMAKWETIMQRMVYYYSCMDRAPP